MQPKAAIIGSLIFFITLNHTWKAQAWVSRGVYHNDAHPGKCTISPELILSPGQRAKAPNRCATVICANADGSAKFYGCGVLGHPPNCTWGDFEDRNTLYPLCCLKKVVCDDEADLPLALKFQERYRTMFTNKLSHWNDLQTN